MKTKNNVQKAILRSAAVVISFVLISFTVSAQEFWKKLLTNSSFNEIAIAMIETKENTNNPLETNSGLTFRFSAFQDYDNELNLEKWMTNDFYFEGPLFRFTNKSDKNFAPEDWVTNENFLNAERIDEEPMELQAWMTSHQVWNN